MHCGSLLIKLEDSPLTPIVNQVCEETGVPISLMMGNTRKDRAVYARQLAIYRCRKETSRPLPEIGDFFGMRERSTIAHAIRCMERRFGKLPTVANSGNRRLTPAQVKAIRIEHAALPIDYNHRRVGIRALTEKYGITRRHLYGICSREIWKNIA